MGWRERLRRRPLQLRTGFLLVVLGGVVLPFALVGLWLAGSTHRSAETLVRARLAETLAEMVPGVADTWTLHRSRLLELSEALMAAGGLGDEPGTARTGGVPARWAALAGAVERVEVRDAQGVRRAVLEREPAATEADALAAGLVHVRLALPAPLDADDVGSMDAWLHASALLPGDLLLPGVSGSVFALFDPATGAPLLPIPIDASLFARPAFEWGGESWLVARHQLHEPPLVLALAGPVTAAAAPFTEAARRGTLALLIVAGLATALTVLVSRRLTDPLARLVDGVTDITGGQLDRKVPGGGPDEVQRLAAAFNEMTASLRGTLERLSHQEALAAMGEVAASLAHEVRNPLTAVQLDLRRTRKRLHGDPEAERLLTRAMRQLERLDQSVDGALRLARSGRVILRPVELAGPIRTAADAAAPRFAAREAVLDVPAETGADVRVSADPDAVEQLLLNLLLNAADALPPGGRARVSVKRTPETVRVVVSDDGPGMEPHVRARVLEPFFSTRKEGTGLGLSIAHRIALTHGGDLEIESEPGIGTSVALVLPQRVSGADTAVSASETHA